MNLWHSEKAKEIAGVHSTLSGNLKAISGNSAGIWGHSFISGDVSSLRGSVTGLRGSPLTMQMALWIVQLDSHKILRLRSRRNANDSFAIVTLVSLRAVLRALMTLAS